MNDRVLPRFVELQKIARMTNPSDGAYRLAILGNSSTQHLAMAVKGYAVVAGLDLNVYDGDYDQIDIQLLDVSSETYKFLPDAIMLYLTPERIYEDYVAFDTDQRLKFAELYCQRIHKYWELIRMNSTACIIQNTIPEYDDGVFGSFASGMESSFVFQMRKLNYLITEAAVKEKDIFWIDTFGIQNVFGRHNITDNKMYYMAKISVSLEMLPYYAKRIIDVINAFRGKFKKCVILDLDNTLWGGIIGEDGLSGIKIGNLGNGHAFSDIQLWLKELRKRGILLAVCSKNDENVAKEPFEKVPEMILKLDDFAIFVANWDNKVNNIKYNQQTLNIGMDSIVFLDDNPFERELVSKQIPEITVPNLPNDVAEYLSCLRDLNLFETATYSYEDAKRTEQYQVEVKRNEFRLHASSYEEYLKSLNMKCHWRCFDEQNSQRIAQLTQRSNQFNLRTIRYAEGEIKRISEDTNQRGLYFSLKDRYGDYGLISVVILNINENHVAFIDTWVMSCRVLKRGVEKFVLDKIVGVAKEAGCEAICGEYIPTPKNSMVAGLFDELGFSKTVTNKWLLSIHEYSAERNNIEEY